MKVSTIMAALGMVSEHSDPELFQKALPLMEQALALSPTRSASLSDLFMEEFRNKLKHGLKGSVIRLSSVEPMQYRLCLHIGFEESGHRTQIDFSYNDKKAWTSALDVVDADSRGVGPGADFSISHVGGE